MRSVVDNAGREWKIEGTLPNFERVKRDVDVDMLTLQTTQQCLRQIDDAYTLVRVLYTFVQHQAEAQGVTPEEFGTAWNADSLSAGADAIIEETIFFSRSRLRPALTMAFKAAKKKEEQEFAAIEAALPEIEVRMAQALASTGIPTDSATSVPASSESSPGDGPSDNSSGRSKAASGRRGNARAR